MNYTSNEVDSSLGAAATTISKLVSTTASPAVIAVDTTTPETTDIARLASDVLGGTTGADKAGASISFAESTGLATEVQLLMYCMYCSLAVAGITSNLIVCYIIVSSQRMRTATNLFLINLAVGDIMMSCLCIPFAFVSNLIYQYWPFGSVMCVVVSYAQANSVFVSAYTMVAISIDRYLAIMYPMRLRMTKLQAKILIAVIWSAAVLTSLPTALLSGLAPISGSEHESCVEQWDNPDSRYYYSMALMVLQYFLPLLVLVITYTRIGIVVWGKRTPGEAENARDARIARSKRKMIKMMITCVIAFALTWLPFNAFIVIGDYYPSIYTFDWIIYIWFVSHYLAMCHTITNPIIYYWMNNRFRLGFRYVFYNVLCCCRHSMNDLKHGNVTDHELEHTRCTNLNAYNRSGESGNSRLLHANNNNHHTNNSHSQTSDLNSNNNGTIVKPSSGSVRVKHGQGNEYVTLGTDWPGSRVTGSTSASNGFSKTDSHSVQHYEALQPTKDGTRDEQSGVFMHFDEKDPRSKSSYKDTKRQRCRYLDSDSTINSLSTRSTSIVNTTRKSTNTEMNLTNCNTSNASYSTSTSNESYSSSNNNRATTQSTNTEFAATEQSKIPLQRTMSSNDEHCRTTNAQNDYSNNRRFASPMNHDKTLLEEAVKIYDHPAVELNEKMPQTDCQPSPISDHKLATFTHQDMVIRHSMCEPSVVSDGSDHFHIDQTPSKVSSFEGDEDDDDDNDDDDYYLESNVNCNDVERSQIDHMSINKPELFQHYMTSDDQTAVIHLNNDRVINDSVTHYKTMIEKQQFNSDKPTREKASPVNESKHQQHIAQASFEPSSPISEGQFNCHNTDCYPSKYERSTVCLARDKEHNYVIISSDSENSGTNNGNINGKKLNGIVMV